MTEQEILSEFKTAGALLEGHFILTSGLRSPRYVQCARALMDPQRAERLCKALVEKVRASGIQADAVVAPAMGGLIVGYELARQLGLPSMFCERVESVFHLRRGFELNSGDKVLIVEDVVTTGKSSMEAAACITAQGAHAVAVASLIDRRASNDVQLTLPLVSLLKLDIPTYAADQLPPELAAIPAVKPGSRGLKSTAA